MKRLRSIARVALIVLCAFLSLTAVAGGIGLLAGFNAPPVSQLDSTIFKNFVVPGIALLVLVGGCAALATALLVRNSRIAPVCAALGGIMIMCFEFVEVMAIGSPPGAAFVLQVFYFALGVLIVTAGLGMWLIDLAK